jgi:FAD/FMN-containing dehydrogenase
MVEQVLSWGRCHRFNHTRIMPASIDEAREAVRSTGPVLPFGLGRSYGDSCLNDGGTLIDTCRLDHFISFDEDRGELVCEAGVTLKAILELLATKRRPDGGYWFLPVVPGTKFVTVGGAIANDVHGKNHEEQGTFGCHVEWLELARSNGALLRCSAEENVELFRATIGGLGLTGLITRAALRLMKVPSLKLEVEHIRLRNLDDYYRVSGESRSAWSHHAAWVDVLASGGAAGRGIYTRSRFTDCDGEPRPPMSGPPVPIEPPLSLIRYPTIKVFNALYRRKLVAGTRHERCVPYDPVFFPLDGIQSWNKIYGPRGFYQYQCAVPKAEAPAAVRALLNTIAKAGQGSFLTVLKEFGDVPSPGLLSFPMPGTTLAVDFPNRGAETLQLLDRLDEITSAAGGRVYAAKDGRAAPEMLSRGYSEIDRFRQSIDPAFSSTYWRRNSA